MRRCLLGFLVLALGCGVSADERASAPDKGDLPADLRTRKTGDDWPCFLGPTHQSHSAEKGILAPWPKDGPPLVWEKRVGTGYAAPVIAQGRLFHFDRVRNRCRLTCMKAETGEEVWASEYATDYVDSYGYNNGPRCCPVVDEGLVYTYGPEGLLRCVRVDNGKEVWKVDTREEFGVVQNFFGVGSTPVIEGDLLIAQVGGSPKGSDNVDFGELKGNGSGVVAFDKRTGKVKYKFSDELASYASPVLTTVGERRWCFVFARGGLIGFDPATGKQDFHYPWRSKLLESVNAANPVVVGDKVFISECYGIGSALLQVKPGEAKEVWTDAKTPYRDKTLLSHWATPIHVDGYLYGCSGRHSKGAEFRCIELATGKEMWSVGDLLRTSFLLVDGHLIVLGEEGLLLLVKVNPKKYEEVSRAVLTDPKDQKTPLLREPCWAAPVLSNGLLYVRGEGRLVCLELIPQKK